MYQAHTFCLDLQFFFIYKTFLDMALQVAIVKYSKYPNDAH